MRIDKALQEAAKRLAHVSDRPRFEAELLLSHCLGVDRVYLHAHGDEEIEEGTFWELVERRAAYEPIEYITNKVSFYSRTFYVEPGVLIPRPETELLVEQVAKEISGSETVAEIGVGSGAVAVTLKLLFPHIRMIGTDISSKALEVTRKNAKLHGVELKLYHTSYLEGIDAKVDIIVSNPPYIKRGTPLEPNVARYEPHEALFAGTQGDEMLKRIIDIFIQSSARTLACEMGYDQKESIESYVARKEAPLKIAFYKDLAGLDRGFVLKKEKN